LRNLGAGQGSRQSMYPQNSSVRLPGGGRGIQGVAIFRFATPSTVNLFTSRNLLPSPPALIAALGSAARSAHEGGLAFHRNQEEGRSGVHLSQLQVSSLSPFRNCQYKAINIPIKEYIQQLASTDSLFIQPSRGGSLFF